MALRTTIIMHIENFKDREAVAQMVENSYVQY